MVVVTGYFCLAAALTGDGSSSLADPGAPRPWRESQWPTLAGTKQRAPGDVSNGVRSGVIAQPPCRRTLQALPPDGRLVALDRDAGTMAVAEKHWRLAGVHTKVTMLHHFFLFAATAAAAAATCCAGWRSTAGWSLMWFPNPHQQQGQGVHARSMQSHRTRGGAAIMPLGGMAWRVLLQEQARRARGACDACNTACAAAD